MIRITTAELTFYQEQGYLILPDLLTHEQMGSMRSRLRPYLQGQNMGHNDFDGYRTERVHGLLNKAEVFADLVAHPQLLRVLDRLMERNYLLSSCSAVLVHARETPQVWHFEDDYIRSSRPRDAMTLSVFWALDPFTDENCVVEVLPGSHLWPEEDPPWGNDKRRAVIRMEPGSALIASGMLYHRSGLNRCEQNSLFISTHYCQPWVRQQENLMLSVPLEMAQRYPTRVQELLGYSVHFPFIGHVEGKHPKKLLE